MKKIVSSLVFVIVTLMTLSAQDYDALKKVSEDWRKSAAMEGPRRFDEVVISKAPKGYSPVYISHYGRHGSRYSWSSQYYKIIHQVFSDAHEAGVLTEVGERFHEKYEAFYEMPLLNTGHLTELGFRQHKKIGGIVYDNFPKVFSGGRRVDALSSTSQRCIVSMGAFCLGLGSKSTDLDIHMSTSNDGMCIVAPPSCPVSLRREFKKDDVAFEPWEEYAKKIVDLDAINARIFTDPAFIDGYEGGIVKFADIMHNFLSGYRNYSDEELFKDTFTHDQIVSLWEATNYGSYCSAFRERYNMIPLLEDIIAKADASLDDPSKAADLRFGHDYILFAFNSLINVNGCGRIITEPSEVKYWSQSYNMCMATTDLFVFYKNKAGDVLFKLVVNEHDTMLPQLTPVEGCYYHWSDFKEWAAQMMAEHPEI